MSKIKDHYEDSIRKIEKFIHHEMLQIEGKINPDQKYHIYKNGFNMLLDELTVYKPLLSIFKNEYEKIIERIKRDHKNAEWMQQDIHNRCCQPITIENYTNRCVELERKLAELRAKQSEMNTQILGIKSEIKSANELIHVNDPLSDSNHNSNNGTDKTAEKYVHQLLLKTETAKKPEAPTRGRLPAGLNASSASNISTMKHHLNGLRMALRDLQINKANKFTHKNNEAKLQEGIRNKLELRRKLRQEVKQMKYQRVLRTALIKAIKPGFPDNFPPHQSLGEVWRRCIQNLQFSDELKLERQESFASTFMTEDASHNTESIESATKHSAVSGNAEAANSVSHSTTMVVGKADSEPDTILETIDFFESLIQKGTGNYKKLQKAAEVAATSFQGVLRTMDTINKLKNISLKTSNDAAQPSVLLYFLELLVATSHVFHNDVSHSHSLTFECVSEALKHNRFDIISHWLAKNRLAISESIGDLLVDTSNLNWPHSDTCLELAAFVYRTALERQLCPDAFIMTSSSMQMSSSIGVSYYPPDEFSVLAGGATRTAAAEAAAGGGEAAASAPLVHTSLENCFHKLAQCLLRSERFEAFSTLIAAQPQSQSHPMKLMTTIWEKLKLNKRFFVRLIIEFPRHQLISNLIGARRLTINDCVGVLAAESHQLVLSQCQYVELLTRLLHDWAVSKCKCSDGDAHSIESALRSAIANELDARQLSFELCQELIACAERLGLDQDALPPTTNCASSLSSSSVFYTLISGILVEKSLEEAAIQMAPDF